MQVKKTYFIAGIYGVGKSTLCQHLSETMGYPEFSAGDLISRVSGERYGANKFVRDKNKNQDNLIGAVRNVLDKYEKIFLAGHFCIFNSNYSVEMLPDYVFDNLSISKIILLEAELGKIVSNLKGRDKREYSAKNIEQLQIKEREQAQIISEKIKVPLMIHKMKFDDSDTQKIIDFIIN